MPSTRLVILALAGALALGIYLWNRPTEAEAALLAAIDAIEGRHIDEVFSYVDPAFTDSYGTSIESLRPIVAEAFQRYSDIRFKIDEMTSRSDGPLAEVHLRFRVLVSYAGRRGYALGSFREPQEAFIDMRRGPGGRYRITAIRGIGKIDRAIRRGRRD